MTEGHGTCGQPTGGRKRPQRGRTTSSLAIVRPLRGRLGRAGLLSAGYIPFGHSTSGYSHSPPSGTIGESRSTIRRLHSLRSFHQRLFTFAPFGDDWGEQVYYPQVAFPSVIPPAVIHIRPLRGRLGRAGLLSAGCIPFGHSTSGYSHSPPSGTARCCLRNFS